MLDTQEYCFHSEAERKCQQKTVCLGDVWPCEMLEKSCSGLLGLAIINLSLLLCSPHFNLSDPLLTD